LPSVVSPRPRPSPLFPYTTLFRSYFYGGCHRYNYNWRSAVLLWPAEFFHVHRADAEPHPFHYILRSAVVKVAVLADINRNAWPRSEEHTSELQSRENLVCRLLLEK